MLKISIAIILINNIYLGFTEKNKMEYVENCKKDFYLDTVTLQCQPCPGNSSMVTSEDGFSCSCDDHSVRINAGQCRKCNSSEVVTPDGTACVPRRCIKDSSGRRTCRKCPAEYIVVTQNFDGSPLKEVQCIKCARGYRATSGRCVKCEDCVCAKSELAVRGQCLPRSYITSRVKPETNVWHPNDMLDMVKYEYLCGAGDIRACRDLASICVTNMYNTDLGGPCRLWIQGPAHSITGLPELTCILESTDDLQSGEITLKPEMNTIKIVLVRHEKNGGINIFQDQSDCLLPQSFEIGTDFSVECHMNVTELLKKGSDYSFAPYLEMDEKLLPIPISIKKPGGILIQRGIWKSSNFRRYFLAKSSSFENSTSVTYLKNLNIQLRLRREKPLSRLLIMHLQLVAEYDTLSSYSNLAVISLILKNQLPSAGVLRALEIWGGVLGAMAGFYGMIQWRGAVRRGGPTVSLGPILAGCVADALYTSAIMASLHAIASETVTTGLALPLASAEESILEALLYSALGLKMVKVIWLNWCQCRCDVFLLDWAEYNPSIKEKEDYSWRTTTVAREWLALQTQRRVSPAYTVPISLAFLQLMKPWQSSLPNSRGYHCAVISIAWWSAYVIVAIYLWIERRLLGSPSVVMPRVCRATGVSLLVFQEEYLAHYVNGRNEDAIDLRAVTGPLTCCRVICAQQLRSVYKQLLTSGGMIEGEARRMLLTKFLAAFFERALDGINWVASERTVLERLLDVELNVRESKSTSILLYDQQSTTPTCMNVTWWGEEGNVAFFDAILFTGVFLVYCDTYLSAFSVLLVWQVMKYIRDICGRKNFKTKTEINDNWF